MHEVRVCNECFELHMFRETGHAVSEERWGEIKPIILRFLADIG